VRGAGRYNQGSFVYFAKRCRGWVFAGVNEVVCVDVGGSSVPSGCRDDVATKKCGRTNNKKTRFNKDQDVINFEIPDMRPAQTPFLDTKVPFPVESQVSIASKFLQKG